jgi:hypothetical protein
MDAPPEEQQNERQVPAYVALVRIIAVIGMSTALAIALFLTVGGFFLAGLVAAVIAVPFFALMRLVERSAEHSAPQE